MNPRHFPARILLCVAASVALHGLLLLGWRLHAPAPPALAAASHEVTVDLLAPAASETAKPVPPAPPIQPAEVQPAPPVIHQAVSPAPRPPSARHAAARPVTNPPPSRELPAATPTAPSVPTASSAPLPAAAAATTAPSTASASAPVVPATPALVPPSHQAASLHNPKPEYPSLSRRLGEQGNVLLTVLVSADGRAQTVHIKQSSGSSRLDEAARRTVERWRFIPASQSGVNVASPVDVPIQFSLR